MTSAPNKTAMIPIHAGAELAPGGAPLGIAPGGAAGAWGGGAAGSASVMTSQRYYAAQLTQVRLPVWQADPPSCQPGAALRRPATGRWRGGPINVAARRKPRRSIGVCGLARPVLNSGGMLRPSFL